MFVASYQRTMASAKKPRPKQDDGVRVVDLVQIRKEREQAKHILRGPATNDDLIRARAEAAEMIRRGREAAMRVRKGEASIYCPSFDAIVDRICRALKVERREIFSQRRHREVVIARHAIMYWACRLTPMSLPEIGRRLGGRDHTTCIWGRDQYPKKRAKMGRHLRPVR